MGQGLKTKDTANKDPRPTDVQIDLKRVIQTI